MARSLLLLLLLLPPLMLRQCVERLAVLPPCCLGFRLCALEQHVSVLPRRALFGE